MSSEPRRSRSGSQRISILVFAILQIAATTLPSLGIGEPIGDRSDSVRTEITPAGWAFSIWGLLFAGSVAYAIYQLLPPQRDNALLKRIGWPSAGAFFGNTIWALYVQFGELNAGSALIISFTLVCLLLCYQSLADTRVALSKGEQLLVALPLSALAGWLTAATIVNIVAVLAFHGLDLGDATSIAGAGVVLVAGVIASATIWNGSGNPWYALVFLWALAGIYGANVGGSAAILFATIASAIMVVGTTLLQLRHAQNRSHWFGTPEGAGLTLPTKGQNRDQ